MTIISNMKIGTRLALGFCIVLACALIILLAGLWQMSALQANSEFIIGKKVAGLTSAVAMRGSGDGLALALQKVVAPIDLEHGKAENLRVTQLMKAYEADAQKLSSFSDTPEASALFKAADAQKKLTFPMIDKIRELVGTNNYFDARQILTSDLVPVYEKWMQSLNALAAFQQQEMIAADLASRQSFARGRMAMLGMGLFTLMVGAFFTWFIRRSIIAPLLDARHIAKTIAGGDLTMSIENGAEDEAGQLVNALKEMQQNLISTIHEIKQSADVISVASQEIAAGNLDLSNRTESQASNLEET